MSGAIVHIEIPGVPRRAGHARSGAHCSDGSSTNSKFPSAEYLLTRISEDQGATISNSKPQKRGIRPYLAVDDRDASIIRVAELRGEVYEKMAVPGAGWFALRRATNGNQFGLWQSDPAAQLPTLDPTLSEFHPGSDED